MVIAANPYRRVAAEMLEDDPDVSESTHHTGVDGLIINGYPFAMLVGEHVVVRLPQARALQLQTKGVLSPYVSGGRVSRNWMAVLDAESVEMLMHEARSFASVGH